MIPHKRVICVVPVYNEEAVLPQTLELLVASFRQHREVADWLIVVANNGSTDSTEAVGRQQEKLYPREVSLEFVAKKGRGQAFKQVFAKYDAGVYCYIDADLPCDLDDFHAVIAAAGPSANLVISKRLGKRPLKRRLITRGLSLANWLLLGMHVSDSQCATKAFTTAVRNHVVPVCQQDGWFFDTEIAALTVAAGLSVKEIPTHWIEQRFAGRQSKVNAWSDMKKGMVALWQIRKVRSRLMRKRAEPDTN